MSRRAASSVRLWVGLAGVAVAASAALPSAGCGAVMGRSQTAEQDRHGPGGPADGLRPDGRPLRRGEPGGPGGPTVPGPGRRTSEPSEPQTPAPDIVAQAAAFDEIIRQMVEHEYGVHLERANTLLAAGRYDAAEHEVDLAIDVVHRHALYLPDRGVLMSRRADRLRDPAARFVR
jgi:hypothetical protein